MAKKTSMSYERGPKGPCIVISQGSKTIRHYMGKREVYATATVMLGEMAHLAKIYR